MVKSFENRAQGLAKNAKIIKNTAIAHKTQICPPDMCVFNFK